MQATSSLTTFAAGSAGRSEATLVEALVVVVVVVVVVVAVVVVVVAAAAAAVGLFVIVATRSPLRFRVCNTQP